jgi:hypothetical protein
MVKKHKQNKAILLIRNPTDRKLLEMIHSSTMTYFNYKIINNNVPNLVNANLT